MDGLNEVLLANYKEGLMANIFAESPIMAMLRNAPEVEGRREVVHNVYGSYANLWELREGIDLMNGIKRDMWGDEEDDY